MKRWDSLVDGYVGVCEARGLSAETLRGIVQELDRCGTWLKRRRPKPKLEEVNGQMLIEYLKRRTHFHSKATVSGVTSKLRCLGQYLVEQGVWAQNPMRWIRGPRLDA
ncbi:MAG TPA: site-specific integrase, partial [Candidatus Sulfotelmatobacter sp.]|nr:site-specific integrase [Candidatus Sulfotelmatobacter sp.]